MNEQQDYVLKQVNELLGEHFGAFILAVSFETDEGGLASDHFYNGNFYEALGLAEVHMRAMRNEFEEA